ncbi:MAG: hypothetical protein AB7N70_16520 [Dehalococcoidia bacterium]
MYRELDALPVVQRLLDFKQFSVFFAMAQQMPMVMAEIARERERIFRAYDEVAASRAMAIDTIGRTCSSSCGTTKSAPW